MLVKRAILHIQSLDLRARIGAAPGARALGIGLLLSAVLLGSVLAQATLAQAAEEVFPLPLRVQAELAEIGSTSTGPEGDWGRQSVVIAGCGLRALTPIDQKGLGSRKAEIRRLTKHLFSATVMQSAAQIGIWNSDGTLYGIEFNLFGVDDPVAPPLVDDHLGVVGQLTGLDANGQAITVGWMYCYDFALYQARLATLNATQGGAPSADCTVYPGPVLQASNSGRYALYLPTTDSTITGDLLSNGGIRLDGDNDAVPHNLRARGRIAISGNLNSIGPHLTEQQETALPTAEQTTAQYQNLASANSMFFNQDITIVNDGAGGLETSQGLPINGIVYVVGNVTAEFTGTTAVLTLIAEGSIEYAGANNVLTSAVDDLLAWAIKDPSGDTDNDVVLSGDGNTISGKVFAPGGVVQISADNVVVTGNLIGWKILISGDGHTIGDGTSGNGTAQ